MKKDADSVMRASFWEVNYIDVYQRGEAPPDGEPTTTTTIETTSTVTVTVTPAPPSQPSLTFTSQASSSTQSPSSQASQSSGSETVSSGTLSSPSETLSSGTLVSSETLSSGTLSSQTPSSDISLSETPSPTTTQSSSSAQPTPSNGTTPPGTDPIAIGEYAFLGCFASEDGFAGFEIIATEPDMTPTLCVDRCRAAGRPFAGVNNNQCLCAGGLNPRARALTDLAQCDIPCPGDPAAFCGGRLEESIDGFSVAPLALRRRQVRLPSDNLLSMYGVVGGGGEMPEPAPPLGEGSEWQGGWIIITIPYVTVCPTDPAKLITTEYCFSARPCNDGCDRPPPPPPMTTIVEVCDGCGPGGESDITLTVPDVIIVSPTPPPPSPPTPAPQPPPPPPPPPADRLTPTEAPEPGFVSPPDVVAPTGFATADAGAVLSIGVAILVPIAVALMRLIL